LVYLRGKEFTFFCFLPFVRKRYVTDCYMAEKGLIFFVK